MRRNQQVVLLLRLEGNLLIWRRRVQVFACVASFRSLKLWETASVGVSKRESLCHVRRPQTSTCPLPTADTPKTSHIFGPWLSVYGKATALKTTAFEIRTPPHRTFYR